MWKLNVSNVKTVCKYQYYEALFVFCVIAAVHEHGLLQRGPG